MRKRCFFINNIVVVVVVVVRDDHETGGKRRRENNDGKGTRKEHAFAFFAEELGICNFSDLTIPVCLIIA